MSAFSPAQMHRLDLACSPLWDAFGGVYLVGTATKRGPYRDVDVRCMLSDKKYDRLVKALGIEGITALGLMVSHGLAALTDMPIDFQFQRTTEANAKHAGIRNPLGTRHLASYIGDAPKGADE